MPPLDAWYLKRNGRVMKDDNRLVHYKVKQDDTLRVCLRVLGGAGPEDLEDDDALIQATIDIDDLKPNPEDIASEAAAHSPSPSESLQSLLALLRTLVPDNSVKVWRTAIRVASAPALQALAKKEQAETARRLNEIVDRYEREGIPLPRYVIHNGSSHSTVAMLAYWPSDHHGKYVLEPDNYTMKPFYLKGFTGSDPRSAAFDLVAWKLRDEQHKKGNLPTWKRDLDKFADQLYVLDPISDPKIAARVKQLNQDAVRSSIQMFNDVVKESTKRPCFRFIQGKGTWDAFSAKVDAIVAGDRDFVSRTCTWKMPIPYLKHLGGIKGSTTNTEVRVLLRDDQITMVAVCAPHASTRAYDRGSGGLQSINKGIELVSQSF